MIKRERTGAIERKNTEEKLKTRNKLNLGAKWDANKKITEKVDSIEEKKWTDKQKK